MVAAQQNLTVNDLEDDFVYFAYGGVIDRLEQRLGIIHRGKCGSAILGCLLAAPSPK